MSGVANLNVGSFRTAIAVTGTAVRVEVPATGPQISAVAVKALKANAQPVYLGGSGVTSSNGFELQPGDSLSIDIQGLGKMYVNGTEGDKVAILWVGP